MITERNLYISDNGHKNEADYFPSSPDPVALYLAEISKYELLTADEEKMLGRKVRRGQLAYEKLRSLAPKGDSRTDEFVKKNELSSIIEYSPLAHHSKTKPNLEKHLNIIKDAQKENLINTVQDGIKAHELMLISNLRLVMNQAKKQVPNNLTILDYIQEGNDGVKIAAAKFDYRKGFKFSTYATWWIKQKMQRARVNMEYSIRRPVHMDLEMNKLEYREGIMLTETGEIDDQKLSKELGISEKKIKEIRRSRAVGITISLDKPMITSSGDTITPAKILERSSKSHDSKTDCEAESKVLLEQVRGIVKNTLTDPREYDVISKRFNLDGSGPKTLEEIGNDHGVTRERIRQIELMAIRRLKNTRALIRLVNILN